MTSDRFASAGFTSHSNLKSANAMVKNFAKNKPLRVLVVEDSEQIALCVETALIDAGYDVVGPVGRLGAAVMMAQNETLDAAVVDLDLYGESSVPVLEALNQRAVPFVVATAYDIHQTKQRFSNRPWLSKPYSLKVLLTEIDALTADKLSI